MDSDQDRERLARFETELGHKANSVDIASLETRVLRNLLAIVLPITMALFGAAVGICLALK